MSHIHWVARQNKLGVPRDKDEVIKREIHECDGRAYDPDTMVAPLTPKPTHKAEPLARAPSTIASRREEDVALRKWSWPRYCCGSCVLETKTKVGSTVGKAPAPHTYPNIDEVPTTPKSYTHPSHECDRRPCDSEATTAPPTPKPTHKDEPPPPTIDSRREEDAALRKWPWPRYCCSSCILETKTKVGSTVGKTPAPHTYPNIDEAPTAPKSHTHPSHECDGRVRDPEATFRVNNKSRRGYYPLIQQKGKPITTFFVSERWDPRNGDKKLGTTIHLTWHGPVEKMISNYLRENFSLSRLFGTCTVVPDHLTFSSHSCGKAWIRYRQGPSTARLGWHRNSKEL